MAALVQEWGVKPELEVFDLGHIRFAKAMVEEGLIDAPPMFQLCLGIPWGADQTVETMAASVNPTEAIHAVYRPRAVPTASEVEATPGMKRKVGPSPSATSA